LEDVTLKFRQQLMQITRMQETDTDVSFLKERCGKAVRYYQEKVTSHILVPLRNCNRELTGNRKKNRTFLKNMVRLEGDIVLFLENMKKVRYNNIALVDFKT
jgi:hypothetical protein